MQDVVSTSGRDRAQVPGSRNTRFLSSRSVRSLQAKDPRALTLAGLIAVLLAAVAAFAHVAEDYLTGDPLVRWDLEFAVWLHNHANGSLVALFKLVTFAGNAAVLGLVVACLATLLARRARSNEAAVIAGALIGAGLLNAGLKLAFHRPRPEIAFLHLDTYSFPSGHAAAAAATYSTIAFLWVTHRRSHRVLVALACAAMVVVVGFSRLYLGVHYLSDVLAGTAFGLAWASLCLLAYTGYGNRDVLRLLPRAVANRVRRFGADHTA